MLLKLMACVCFLFGSGGYGYIKVREYQKRYEELVYIRYILNTLLLETENHRGTFGENCLIVSDRLKEPYRKMFHGLYHLLERERIEEPAKYWADKITALASEIRLQKEEIRILQGVIRCTEGTTLAMPLEVLRQSLTEWEDVIHKADTVRKEKSRVTLCLSVSAGLLLCITII